MRLPRALIICLCVAGCVVGCANPDGDWKEACSAGIQEEYARFLKRYPDSDHASAAVESLHVVGFREARATNTVRAYSAYVSEYPDSPYRTEADARIDSVYWSEFDQAINERFGEEARPILEGLVAARPNEPLALFVLGDYYRYHFEASPDSTQFIARAHELLARCVEHCENGRFGDEAYAEVVRSKRTGLLLKFFTVSRPKEGGDSVPMRGLAEEYLKDVEEKHHQLTHG